MCWIDIKTSKNDLNNEVLEKMKTKLLQIMGFFCRVPEETCVSSFLLIVCSLKVSRQGCDWTSLSFVYTSVSSQVLPAKSSRVNEVGREEVLGR